jgi:hypothetical protein
MHDEQIPLGFTPEVWDHLDPEIQHALKTAEPGAKVDNTFGSKHDTVDLTAPWINGEMVGPLVTRAAAIIRREVAPFTVREICDGLGVLLTEEQQFLLEFIGGLVKQDGVVVIIPTEEEVVEDGVMLSVDLHFEARCPECGGAYTRCND